jgi:hypothetical protein
MTRFVSLLLLASLTACSSSTGPQLSFEGKSTVSPGANGRSNRSDSPQRW